MAFEKAEAGECWKMRSICRDIFEPDGRATLPTLDPAAVVLATLSGLVCSAMVYTAIRGGVRNLWRRNNGSVEFAMVDTDASID